MQQMQLKQDMIDLLLCAKKSARILERLSNEERSAVLISMADEIESQCAFICEANAKDMSAAENLPLAMRKS